MSTKNEWWRTALGEYPTGVTLITSTDAQGQPVAMVVGTFVAVSQDPPLIGFLPDAGSTTFPVVAANGRFSASVLGAEHEALCRAFARKDPDRFQLGEWVTSEAGVPRLRDALAWFDAGITESVPAGDHSFVVGAVEDFGVGDGSAGLPLLFLRGGYGSFAVPTAGLDPDSLVAQLRAAEAAGPLVRQLASELGAQVMVSTVAQDAVVVLDETAPSDHQPTSTEDGGAPRPRAKFPFAAPLAPAFVAWGDDRRRSTWIENSRHLIGSVDRPALASLLQGVRDRGYAVSTGQGIAAQFEALVTEQGTTRASYSALWRSVAEQNAETARHPHGLPEEVSSLQAPVFGPHGYVELVLNLSGFDPLLAQEQVEQLGARLLGTCREVTALIGGRWPADSTAASSSTY